MQYKKDVQHVFLVGAKSLGAYGGYETFIYKLTEYHQNNKNIKYHVACKANGDGCMDETKEQGVVKISDNEFEFHNAHCFKIHVPQIGAAQAIYYDVAALNACCNSNKWMMYEESSCVDKICAAEMLLTTSCVPWNKIYKKSVIKDCKFPEDIAITCLELKVVY